MYDNLKQASAFVAIYGLIFIVAGLTIYAINPQTGLIFTIMGGIMFFWGFMMTWVMMGTPDCEKRGK